MLYAILLVFLIVDILLLAILALKLKQKNISSTQKKRKFALWGALLVAPTFLPAGTIGGFVIPSPFGLPMAFFISLISFINAFSYSQNLGISDLKSEELGTKLMTAAYTQLIIWGQFAFGYIIIALILYGISKIIFFKNS